MVIKSNNNGKSKGSYLLCAFCVSDTAEHYSVYIFPF